MTDLCDKCEDTILANYKRYTIRKVGKDVVLATLTDSKPLAFYCLDMTAEQMVDRAKKHIKKHLDAMNDYRPDLIALQQRDSTKFEKLLEKIYGKVDPKIIKQYRFDTNKMYDLGYENSRKDEEIEHGIKRMAKTY